MLSTFRSSFALHSLYLSKFSSPSPASHARQASSIPHINLSNLEAVGEELRLNQDNVAMVGDLWRRDDQYTTTQTIRKVLQEMIIKQKI